MKKTITYLALTVLLTLSAGVSAQSRIIRGSVTDEYGKGIEGALVTAVETGQNTMSRQDGTFLLVITSQVINLKFSSDGYFSQTKALQPGSDLLDAKLSADITGFETSVVSPPGIAVKARDAGAAVVHITGTELSHSTDRSVLGNLQGKAAGAWISSAGGASGASNRIQLRGITSFLGNNQPLIVVDGIVMENPTMFGFLSSRIIADFGNRINDIDPANIKAVDVLPGATAALLYGSRASSGAIMITTKNGSGQLYAPGKMSVQYQSSWSVENVLRQPSLQTAFGQGNNGTADLSTPNSWGPALTGDILPWGQSIAGDQRNAAFAAVSGNTGNLFRTGHTLSNHISINGGGDKNGYYFSFGDLRNTGVLQGMDYRRNTVQANAYTKLSNHFTSDFRIGFVRSETGALNTTGPMTAWNAALQTPVNISLADLKDGNSAFNTPSGFYSNRSWNPWFILMNASNRNVANNFISSATMVYHYRDNMKFTLRAGTNYSSDHREGYEPTSVVNSGPNASFANYTGYAYQDWFDITSSTIDLFANTKHQFGDHFSLTGLAGVNLYNTSMKAMYTYQKNTSGAQVSGGSEKMSQALYGAYANVGLGWNGAVLLNLRARNDMTDALPKSQQNILNYGAELAVNVQDLASLPTWLPYLKLRGAYAKTGNVPNLNYMAGAWVPGSGRAFGSDSFFRSAFGNRGILAPFNGLKAETTESLEAGIDLVFSPKNRYKLSATAYMSESENLICLVPATSGSGYDVEAINSGKMNNKGVEVTASAWPVLAKNTSVMVGATFLANLNEVTATVPGGNVIALGSSGRATSLVASGFSYGQLTSSDFTYSPDKKVVVDQSTGMPIISPGVNVGSFLPSFIASLFTGVHFHQFELYVQADHQQGGHIYSSAAEITQQNGSANNTLGIGSGNQRQDEVVPNSVVQGSSGDYLENTKAISVQNYWQNMPGSLAILSATYTKIRDVSIRYNVPAEKLKRWPLGAIQLGVSGRNLLLFTPKSNHFIDPENSSFGASNLQGFAWSSISGLRSISFNLKLNF